MGGREQVWAVEQSTVNNKALDRVNERKIMCKN